MENKKRKKRTLLENLINKQKKVIKGELFKEKESKEKTR